LNLGNINNPGKQKVGKSWSVTGWFW